GLAPRRSRACPRTSSSTMRRCARLRSATPSTRTSLRGSAGSAPQSSSATGRAWQRPSPSSARAADQDSDLSALELRGDAREGHRDAPGRRGLEQGQRGDLVDEVVDVDLELASGCLDGQVGLLGLLRAGRAGDLDLLTTTHEDARVVRPEATDEEAQTLGILLDLDEGPLLVPGGRRLEGHRE